MRSPTRTDSHRLEPRRRPVHHAQPPEIRSSAVGAPLAVLATGAGGPAGASRLVAGGVWLVFFSSRARGRGGRGRRCRAPWATRRSGPPLPCRTASRWPGSTSTRSRRGSRRWPSVRSAEVTRQWPNGVLISRGGARRDRGRRDRWADPGDGRRRRRVPRLREGPACPATCASRQRRPAPTRCRRRPRSWPPCRRRSRSRVDYVSVATIDQIELVLRDGRTVTWGSAEDSEQKAAVLVRLLEQPGEALRRECAEQRHDLRLTTEIIFSASHRGVSPRFTSRGCLLSYPTRG